MPIFRGEIEDMHPKFVRGSKACAVGHRAVAYKIEEPRLEYTEADDESIERLVRETGEPWYSLSAWISPHLFAFLVCTSCYNLAFRTLAL